jgi:hypothetical protein
VTRKTHPFTPPERGLNGHLPIPLLGKEGIKMQGLQLINPPLYKVRYGGVMVKKRGTLFHLPFLFA